MKLKGKTVVITGAGAGIGRAIAVRYAHEGARVVVSDINKDTAEAVTDQIIENGGSAIVNVCDVADTASVEVMIKEANNAFGPVDILVNNAGGAIYGGKDSRTPFHSCPKETIERMIWVNLVGTLFCSRAVVQEMMERRSGKIINMASITGVVGTQNGVLYSTAKGGIIAFTKSLAMDMGEYGVTVNAISPGAIATRPGPASLKTYLNRTGTADEVANLALFLASDEADFITGQNYIIDGGRCWGALR
jgi:NAD(P)-dependent dehydrogenase (short-subunit alcohol dehydrogenase family)